MNFSSRQSVKFGALVLGATGFAILSLLIDRSPDGVISLAWPDASFARFRFTALAVGIIVGAALAISGVLLQALLRNPLASPYILGVSNGAGLGVMFAMYLSYSMSGGELGIAGQTGPSIIGGLATLAIVYALGQRRGWLDPVSLVLIGVVVSTICGAGILFFQHMVPTGLRGQFTTWIMGHLPQGTPLSMLVVCGSITFIALIISMIMGKAMDAATLGDDEARSVGLAIGPLRVMLFGIAGLLAALTVALAGPIGFVGLISPHGARLILGPRHTMLVPGAALFGIMLVVGSYVGSRLIDVGAGQMPIGIFTALIGGPAFIWLLLSGRGQA
ncbi:MAG: iron ABC transporter permease [Planctomycetota bacterium]|nr:iron ABC transporter permease [Planctomycetota bacterium]